MATRCIRHIYDPSPMTEDNGSIFVEYTIVAVVHMIYTMETSY